jgi:hypothetical protein
MPWYVAHGNIVAWLLVGIVAVAPLGVIRLVRARRDRKLAREDRAPFEIGSRAPGEGPITVRGILRGGTVTWTETSSGVKLVRPETLWLEHEGERIDLVGEILVVRGTRATATWRTRSYEVREGDNVIVRGTASRTTSSYREQAWKLEPDGETEPIELCAERPASRARPIHPAWIAGLLAAFGASGYFGLRWFGKHQLDKAKETHYELRIPLTWTTPAALAAMLPGNRDRALAYLWAYYGAVLERSEDNLAARVEIAERLRGRMRWLIFPNDTPSDQPPPTACEAGADELLRQTRFERALAKNCKSHRIDPDANLALGYYDKAGGSQDATARAIVELAGGPSAGPTDTLAVPRACVSLLARALNDDSTAIRDLGVLASKNTSCALALALAYPPADRAERLAAIRIENPDSPAGEYERARLADFRWALDPTFVEEPDSEIDDELSRYLLGFGPGVYGITKRETLRRSMLRRTWLSAIAVDTARDVHVYRAFAATLRGDFAAARTELAASSRTDLLQSLAVREQTGGNKSAEAVDPDGREQARRMRTSSLGWPELSMWILESGSGVTKNREELQRAVRVLATDSRLPLPSDLLTFVHEIAVVRDVHRAVGDADQVKRWQTIIDRHLAAFADPHKRLLLVLTL